MRIPRPIRTLLPALLLGTAAIPPAAVSGDDGNGWTATRSAAARRNVSPRSPAHRDARSLPADEQPPVSTWSQIRRAALQHSPHGMDWPSLQTADYSRHRPASAIGQAHHSEAAGPVPEWSPAPPRFGRDDDHPFCRTWQLLPPGLLFKSYMAGTKESRLGTATLHQSRGDTFQESTLGGRVGIVRFGTPRAIRPQGWQLDFEGAAFLRQNWSEDLDVDAVDFRYGVPLTWRRGPWGAKFAFYHLSSHVGDEFLIRTPGFHRRNYIRDALLAGVSYHVTPDWRVYGEAGYAVHTDGGAEPWELQFGAEYSPVVRNGISGSPFFAANGHLREEVDFGGGVTVMFGWQWRSAVTDRVFRMGVQYYNGKSLQFSFFNRHEQLIGGGLWYDF